ncbi:MAG: chemotaxis protein CheW [Bacteroidetes bacterium]|jgi:purine-binding chemotaxis protein CheW|nr:chemotaxis protein CheW [Bacteroidota bacterium]
MKNEIEILKKRAAQYASRTTEDDSQNQLSVIGFYLHPEMYAIDYDYVKEVKTVIEITSIPGTPDFIMGIINFRGNMLSVVNLKTFFGLKEKGLTEFNKLIIIGKGNFEFGIMTDGILGNLRLDQHKLSAPPLTLSESGSAFVKAISAEGIILLDTEKILNSKQLLIEQ